MIEQRGKQWHLDKSLSISHLITTVMIASSVMIWAMKMDTRISIVEAKQMTSKENQNRIEQQMHDNLGEIKESLIRIESKIDRKVDR